MSVLHGADVRRPSALQALPLLIALLLLPVAATFGLRAASLAEPGVAAVRLDPAQARRASLGVELVPHAELPAALVEVRPAAAGDDARTASVGTPLAATRDGRSVAIAEQLGQDPTTLVIAATDGSQVRIPLNGLLAAGFAPDGSWLAASDGLGRLWRIDAASGAAEPLADGPFAGSLLVEPSGSILALAVSSVEAPFMSRLVRLDASGQTIELVSDEELVYGMTQLDDGGLAVVSHRPSGTFIQRLAAGRVAATTELGSGAVNVTLSADGSVVAWERDGQVMLRYGDASDRLLAPGTNPRIAPNGELLVLDGPAGGSLVLSLEGEIIAQPAGPVVLLECGECRP